MPHGRGLRIQPDGPRRAAGHGGENIQAWIIVVVASIADDDESRPAVQCIHEFVLEIEGEPEKVLEKLRKEEILGGLPLAKYYPELNHHLLVTVTEMNRKEEIDRWAETLEKAME